VLSFVSVPSLNILSSLHKSMANKSLHKSMANRWAVYTHTNTKCDLAGSASVLRCCCSRGGTARHVKCRLHVKPPTASPPCCENDNVRSLMASIIGQMTIVRSVAIRSRIGSNLQRYHSRCKLFVCISLPYLVAEQMCLFNRISKDIMDNRQVKISWIIDKYCHDVQRSESCGYVDGRHVWMETVGG